MTYVLIYLAVFIVTIFVAVAMTTHLLKEDVDVEDFGIIVTCSIIPPICWIILFASVFALIRDFFKTLKKDTVLFKSK